MNSKSASNIRFAIVVLDYNGGRKTLDCVLSFLAIPREDIHVIVVDNNSDDRAIDECAKWDRVTLLPTGKNLGYSGGNNRGIREALRTSASFVLVVNNDTCVTNLDFLERLADYLESNPKVGYAGPKVWFQEVGNVQNTICSMPTFWKSLLEWPLRKIGFKAETSGDVELHPPVLNGVCVMFRREFLESMTVFDEAIFMYREDTDLAIRARQEGWELAYVPIESVVHLQKSTGYDYLGMVNFLLKRNVVYLKAKHGRKWEALLYAISCEALSFFRFMRASLTRGNPRPYWDFFARLRRANRAARHLDVHCDDFGPPTSHWQDV